VGDWRAGIAQGVLATCCGRTIKQTEFEFRLYEKSSLLVVQTTLALYTMRTRGKEDLNSTIRHQLLMRSRSLIYALYSKSSWCSAEMVNRWDNLPFPSSLAVKEMVTSVTAGATIIFGVHFNIEVLLFYCHFLHRLVGWRQTQKRFRRYTITWLPTIHACRFHTETTRLGIYMSRMSKRKTEGCTCAKSTQTQWRAR
jgi:hypothetical protein